jgi:hypothetical protein
MQDWVHRHWVNDPDSLVHVKRWKELGGKSKGSRPTMPN